MIEEEQTFNRPLFEFVMATFNLNTEAFEAYNFRRGTLKFPNIENDRIITPCLSIPCPRGAPKMLTLDQLSTIFSKNLIISMSLSDIMANKFQLNELAMVKADGRTFYGLSQDVPIILTTKSSKGGLSMVKHESATSTQLVSAEIDLKYSTSDHLKLLDILKVNLTVLPAEVLSLDDSAGSKRQTRSVETAHHYYRQFRNEFDSLDCGLLWNSQGGTDLHLREVSSAEVLSVMNLDKQVVGVSVGGLEKPHDLYYKSLKASTSKLPQHSLRFSSIYGHPMEILGAIWHGIDVIDVSFPFIAAEKGIAFSFNTEISLDYEGFQIEDLADFQQIEAAVDKIFATSGKYGCRVNELTHRSYASSLMKLNESSPETHSYIHHLFNCHEMLGSYLVYRHNLEKYAAFMKAIQKLESRISLANYIVWFSETQTAHQFLADLSNYNIEDSYTTFASSLT